MWYFTDVDIFVSYYFFIYLHMWLAEKRIVKQYQDEYLPKIQETIHNLAGVEIPLEVEWDKLPREGSASYLQEWLEKVYFSPIVEALKSICIDEMGKKAISIGVKNIHITNTENDPNPESQVIYFKEGTLFINQMLSNLDADYESRIKEIREALEAWL